MKEINRIAVFTSGGDAPGMNAAIRSVVRTANHNKLHVYGIHEGYNGMVNGKIQRLENRDVANIIHRGGTMLKTARSKEFMTKEGRQKAYDNLMAYDIDACVAIGGNGTYTGAKVFMEEYDIPFIGLPGTIDNDIYGTDYSIGFDTAINTAIEAVDRIRDTADSHNRIFIIEVMGRHSGYIALHSGIGSGAEAIYLPEIHGGVGKLYEILNKSRKRNKLFSLVIVAEGDESGGAMALADYLKDKDEELDIRVTIIGHLQRGGSPTCYDRVLASRLGYVAVNSLLEGKFGFGLGVQHGKTSYTKFEEAISNENPLNEELVKMVEILAV